MPSIDPAKVPENLRDLIPLAEQWGIVADTARHRFAESASDDQLAALANSLTGRHLDIEHWLYSLGPGEEVSVEAAAFRSMLVAEMEECDGPGMRGWLEYALSAWNESPTGEARARLRAAYVYTKAASLRVGGPFCEGELADAERILDIEETP